MDAVYREDRRKRYGNPLPMSLPPATCYGRSWQWSCHRQRPNHSRTPRSTRRISAKLLNVNASKTSDTIFTIGMTSQEEILHNFHGAWGLQWTSMDPLESNQAYVSHNIDIKVSTRSEVQVRNCSISKGQWWNESNTAVGDLQRDRRTACVFCRLESDVVVVETADPNGCLYAHMLLLLSIQTWRRTLKNCNAMQHERSISNIVVNTKTVARIILFVWETLGSHFERWTVERMSQNQHEKQQVNAFSDLVVHGCAIASDELTECYKA